jgi:hypothetical protein
MSSGPGPQKRWNTRRSALYGAGLGVIAGIMHNFFHAFWGELPENDLLTHFLPEMVLLVVAGAALLAAIAAIRNWLRRKP